MCENGKIFLTKMCFYLLNNKKTTTFVADLGVATSRPPREGQETSAPKTKYNNVVI